MPEGGGGQSEQILIHTIIIMFCIHKKSKFLQGNFFIYRQSRAGHAAILTLNKATTRQIITASVTKIVCPYSIVR